MRSIRRVAVLAVLGASGCSQAERAQQSEDTGQLQSALVSVAGFSEATIGMTSAGSSVYANGSLTITGFGDGVQRTDLDPPDNMHFVYMPVTGDVEIVARIYVSGVAATNSQVGLTIRTALGGSDDNATAAIGLGACEGCNPNANEFYTISRQSGARAQVPQPTLINPTSQSTAVWLRLQRIGNDFAAARRLEGSSTWVPLHGKSGGAFLPTGTYNAGFYVGGRSGTTVVFDNLYIGPPRQTQRTTWIGNSFDRDSTGRIGEYLGSLAAVGNRVFRATSGSELGLGLNTFDATTGSVLASPHLVGSQVNQGALAGAGSLLYVAVDRQPLGAPYCVEAYNASTLAPVADNCATQPLGTVGGMAATASPLAPRVYVTQPFGNSTNPNPNVTVLDGNTLSLLGTFNVDARPGPIAVDRLGEVWVVHTSTPYPNVGRLDVNPAWPASIKSYQYPQGTPTGRTIPAGQNPSAIAYRSQSDEILVADNSSAQSVKAYTVNSAPPPASPVASGTIGAVGGVFGSSLSDPTRGLITPTPAGTPRFYNVTGLAVDGSGGIHVASSAGDGVDIAKVPRTGAANFRVFGLMNRQNLVDFDPSTDGQDVYSARHHFTFNTASLTPGGEWGYRALTWDPFGIRVEKDEGGRIARRSGYPIVRTINGQRFLFVLGTEWDADPDGPAPAGPRGQTQWLSIYRFQGEIAVPCGYVAIEWACQPNGCNFDPSTPQMAQQVGILRMWNDRNGNQLEDAGEIAKTPDPFDLYPCQGANCPVSEDTADNVGKIALTMKTFDVDRNGNLWLAFDYGPAEWANITGTGIWQLRLNTAPGGSTPGGAPNYRQGSDGSGALNRFYYHVPAEMGSLRGIRYDAASGATPPPIPGGDPAPVVVRDVMYMIGYIAGAPAESRWTLGAYTNFLAGGSTTFSGTSPPVPSLSQRRFFRNLPDPFATDGTQNDLVYQAIPKDGGGYLYIDPFDYRGLAVSAGDVGSVTPVDKVFTVDRFGDVKAFEASDGKLAAPMLAGPEVSGYKGGLDISEAIRAYRRSTGEYLISAAHTGGTASNLAFRWTPAMCTASVGCSPEDECRGYWRADEGSGTTLVDSSGRSQTGTLTSATWGAGFEGSGLVLPAGSYASVRHSGTVKVMGALTLSAWVKPTATNTLQYVMKKARTGHSNGYELGIAANGRPFMRLNQFTSGDTFRVDAPNAISAGAWTHLAATSDRSVARLFVNGVQVASKNILALNNNQNLDMTVSASQEQLGIGAECRFNSACSPDVTTMFNGTLDEIRLFGRAVPPEQIKLLARRDPVGKWTWADGSLSVAKDDSGACNRGWIRGATAPPAGETSLVFDGNANKYVQFSSSADWNPVSAFTIAAWITPTGSSAQGMVINKAQSGVNGFELSITGGLKARMTRSNGLPDLLVSTAVLAANVSTHVAATYDGQVLRLYRNKALQGSVSAAGVDVTNGLPLTLAADVTGNQNFRGKLSAVQVYRRALDQSELNAL